MHKELCISSFAEEMCFFGIGRIDDRHWTAIFTEHGERIRMISVQRSRLEERFESGESVLDYFDTDVVLTIDRLTELAPILNLSAVAREAGINVQTLQAKIRRRTLLTGDETRLNSNLGVTVTFLAFGCGT